MTVSGTGVIRSIVMAPSKQHLVLAPQTGDAQLWHIMSNSIVHTFKGKLSRIEYLNTPACSECVSLLTIWCSIYGNRTDLKEFTTKHFLDKIDHPDFYRNVLFLNIHYTECIRDYLFHAIHCKKRHFSTKLFTIS